MYRQRIFFRFLIAFSWASSLGGDKLGCYEQKAQSSSLAILLYVVSFWLHHSLNNPTPLSLSLSLLMSKASNGCHLCTRIWLHQANKENQVLHSSCLSLKKFVSGKKVASSNVFFVKVFIKARYQKCCTKQTKRIRSCTVYAYLWKVCIGQESCIKLCYFCETFYKSPIPEMLHQANNENQILHRNLPEPQLRVSLFCDFSSVPDYQKDCSASWTRSGS